MEDTNSVYMRIFRIGEITMVEVFNHKGKLEFRNSYRVPVEKSPEPMDKCVTRKKAMDVIDTLQFYKEEQLACELASRALARQERKASMCKLRAKGSDDGFDPECGNPNICSSLLRKTSSTACKNVAIGSPGAMQSRAVSGPPSAQNIVCPNSGSKNYLPWVLLLVVVAGGIFGMTKMRG